MSARKKTLTQAFVITVAAAGIAAVPACNTVTAFSDSLCPSNAPAHAGLCDAPGQECFYEDDCGSSFSATCTDAAWQIQSPESCNPPFPEPPPEPCPIEAPQDEVYCSTIGQFCDYSSGGIDFCDELYVEATCTDSGWHVEEWWGMGECNPPPALCPIDIPVEGSLCEYDPDSWDGWPSYCAWDAGSPCGPANVEGFCEPYGNGEMIWSLTVNTTCTATPEQCQQWDAEVGCGTDAGCRWLAPSCDASGNNVVAGCYPAADCTVDGCGAWGTCTNVSYDPCHNAECQACAGDTDACIPNP
jgi:hypothetical protein